MGSYSPIPGRGCFGELPGDGIVVSPPPQSLKHSLCHFDVDQAFVQSDLEEEFICDCRKDVVIFQERSFGSTNVCMD